jgi:hypothetical protein
MKVEAVETYLKGRVLDLLKRIQSFEGKIISDREEFMTIRKKVQAYKKENPGSTYEDVKDDLLKLMDLHYFSFLMEQNLQHILNVALELNTMCNVIDLDLNLEGENAEAMRNISKAKPDIFTLNDKNEIVFADDEYKTMITSALDTKKQDLENLKDMYNSLQF